MRVELEQVRRPIYDGNNEVIGVELVTFEMYFDEESGQECGGKELRSMELLY